MAIGNVLDFSLMMDSQEEKTITGTQGQRVPGRTRGSKGLYIMIHNLPTYYIYPLYTFINITC